MNEVVYVRFWRRVWAKILDVLITGIPVAIAYTAATHISVMVNSVIPFLLYITFTVLSVTYITARFGATPGKLILKMKIVNKDGNYIKYLEALKRLVFYSIYLIVLSLVLYQGISEEINSKVINHYMSNSTGLLSICLNVILWITIVDELFVLLNKNRRTIHDYIGKSYLVDLRSRKGVSEQVVDLS